jgi:hypothetical protein
MYSEKRSREPQSFLTLLQRMVCSSVSAEGVGVFVERRSSSVAARREASVKLETKEASSRLNRKFGWASSVRNAGDTSGLVRGRG